MNNKSKQLLNDFKWGTWFFLALVAIVLFGTLGPQFFYAMF